MMGARLFPKHPIHASSFLRIALLISQLLGSAQLTLNICTEIYAILYPLLENAYHTAWIIHPLLCVVQALKHNPETSKQTEHRDLLSKVSFSLDLALSTLYQERQLSTFVANAVLELPPGPSRSAFLCFASKQLLLETNPRCNFPVDRR
jgi:hypothetical protein